MWEEPRPTVTLTLPCPLKEPQKGMYCIDEYFSVCKVFYESTDPIECYEDIEKGIYFATEADAQMWIDAFKNNRA